MLVGENTIEHGLTQIPWSWSFFGNAPKPDDWKQNNFRLADIEKEKSGNIVKVIRFWNRVLHLSEDM